MNVVRFIDLFAGVGGFHKGLQQANKALHKEAEGNSTNIDSPSWGKQKYSSANSRFKCVWANEWNKHAVSIYKARFPQTPLNTEDIRLVKANDIPKADLLCAGFPCQAFSLAGKRKGFEEARGTLFYEICRIAKAKRIPYLLLENVKGLLSAQDHYAFAEVLYCLDELGYCLQWQVLNSKDCGVPQNRERVFIVGCLGEKRFKQVFPLGESDEIFGTKHKPQNISNTITARYYKRGKTDTFIQEGGIVSCALRQRDRHDREEIRQQQLELRQDNVANSLTSFEKDSMVLDRLYTMGNAKPGRSCLGAYRTPEIGNEFGSIRRLTPIECERLQGFPDNWTAGLSDTQRYKCMGNAVTVNVVEAIGRKMLEVDLFKA